MAGKFLHGHQVHSYPADKMTPPSTLQRATDNQRRSIKKQHNRKARRWWRKVEGGD